MKFHEDAHRREQERWSGMARPKADGSAGQHDQWAVLRHEVEGDEMRRRVPQQEAVDWDIDQRDTDEDALSSQLSYRELEEAESQVDIVVVGVGGGGMNAVNRMIDTNVRGVRFVAMNTDAQVLALCEASERICLGQHYTKGLGAGGSASVGTRAAMESEAEIRAALGEADLVFVAAGMGGGTGTGGAPIVASIAKKMGALAVGIVTLPFGFEGTRRRQVAEEGLAALCAEVDAIITVPNDRLLALIGRERSLSESFQAADDVLRQGVQGIAEVINVPGLVNVDFADVRSVLRQAGTALMSIGRGQGRNRAQNAAEEAIAGGFLNVSIRGAQRVLFNISGGEDMTLFEVNEVAERIGSAIHDAADITFGAVIDPALDDTIRVTLIAAGMPEAQTAQIPLIRREQPATPRGSAPRPLSAANPALPPGQSQVVYKPAPPPSQQRNAAHDVPERPLHESGTEIPRRPAPYGEKTVRTPGRPQRSLDDLRGLRGMGRRANLQADEAEEIEMPRFLRRFE